MGMPSPLAKGLFSSFLTFTRKKQFFTLLASASLFSRSLSLTFTFFTRKNGFLLYSPLLPSTLALSSALALSLLISTTILSSKNFTTASSNSLSSSSPSSLSTLYAPNSPRSLDTSATMLCSLLRTMCATATSPASLVSDQKSYFHKPITSSLSSPTMASPASSPLVAPLSPPPSPSMSMESINGDDETRRLRVMIVDDNNLNLDILSRMLDRHFADTVDSVVKVSSGKEALALLADEIFDLILMDIDMPELSGVDTTLEIRSANSVYGVLSANKSVPIIAVTTSDAAHQRKRYLEVGMYDCVSKPIHKDPLRFAIEGALKSVPAVATG